MEITIINSKDGEITGLSESRLVWSSLLFANIVNYATPFASMFSTDKFLPELPERNRIDLIKSCFEKWNLPDHTPEKIEEFYQQYLELKRRKRKSREELILLMTGERYIRELQNHVINGSVKTLGQFKMDKLDPLADTDDENMVIRTWMLGDLRPGNIENTYVYAVWSTLNNNHEIPMFDDTFEKYAAKLNMNENTGEQFLQTEGIKYAGREIYSMANPDALTENQVRIVRKDFKEKYGNFFEAFTQDKEYLKQLKFDADTCGKYYEKQKNELVPSPDENIYLKQILDSEPDIERYHVCAGITSFENLIRMYKLTRVIDEKEELYAKEELGRHVDLGNATLFWYLKCGEK